jgi:hypothetical protein
LFFCHTETTAFELALLLPLLLVFAIESRGSVVLVLDTRDEDGEEITVDGERFL